MTASIKAGSSPVRSASCFISSQNLGNAEQGCRTLASFGSLLAERVHVPKTKNAANVTTRQFVTNLLRNCDAFTARCPPMLRTERIAHVNAAEDCCGAGFQFSPCQLWSI